MLLHEYQQQKKKVFINGMPEEDGGLIISLEQNYIVFEVENKGDKPEQTTTENIIIPRDKINMIGELPVKKTGINSFAQSATPPEKIESKAEIQHPTIEQK